MKQSDETRAIQLREFLYRIEMGRAQAERGEGVDGEVFVEGLIRDLDAMLAEKKI